MRDQEVLDLYEAYASIYSPKREFEGWVNSLVEEGYDLSEYTWDEMYEIYMEEVEQLDEERRDPRGRPASGPMSVYGGRGQDAGPGGSGDERTDRMDAAQRRVKRTQPKEKGMAADALFTRFSARQRGTGGENPSPSDTTTTGYPHSPRRGGRRGRGANTDQGGGNAANRRRQALNASYEYDLFDTILEHLIAEGYADTNEAALVIMANMSEEWKQSIVEAVQIPRPQPQKYMSFSSPGPASATPTPRPDMSTPEDKREAERIRNTPLRARLTSPGGPVSNPGPATGPNGFLNRNR